MSSARAAPGPELPSARTVPAFLAALILGGAGAQTAAAQEMTELRTARRDVGQAERLQVDLEFGAGRIAVGRADPGYLYQKYVRYDASSFRPTSSWSRSDGRGRLRLSLEAADDAGEFVEWGDGEGFDLNLDALRALRDLEDANTSLRLDLSRSVPTDLSLEIGAAESTLALGGVPLTSLTLETGASDTRLSFSRPNPRRMERLEIEAGAASVRTRGLGNARFRVLRLDGGVGDVLLDFTGQWTGDARGTVDVGLGSLRLIVPDDLGVRLRRDSFLASFDVPAGFERTDSGFRSENWSSAEHRLTLDLSAAFGSVRVNVR